MIDNDKNLENNDNTSPTIDSLSSSTIVKIKAKKHIPKHPEIIQIKNFNFSYNKKKTQTLFDINMSIKQNYVTCFIGPSGCGKSTLLKSINRMNDMVFGCIYGGTITVFGEDIFESRVNVSKLRSEVGMVFQKPNPFPISIYDNVVYGPKLQGIKEKTILNQICEDSLKKAALWDEVKDVLNSSALGLSGGQQQRLCIARAIAMHPQVLLMDEPTSALDPIATLKIEELILELKKDYTIILVTHSMQQATRVSDMTAFFLKGKLIEYNRTKRIFTNPKMKETEYYISGRYE